MSIKNSLSLKTISESIEGAGKLPIIKMIATSKVTKKNRFGNDQTVVMGAVSFNGERCKSIFLKPYMAENIETGTGEVYQLQLWKVASDKAPTGYTVTDKQPVDYENFNWNLLK